MVTVPPTVLANRWRILWRHLPHLLLHGRTVLVEPDVKKWTSNHFPNFRKHC